MKEKNLNLLFVKNFFYSALSFPKRWRQFFLIIFFSALSFGLNGCRQNSPFFGHTFNEGYILEPNSLNYIPLKSSMDQVLLVLGSPSFISYFDKKTFYYISQKRYRFASFSKGKIVDRKVLVIDFNSNDEVIRLANYGLKDGRIFNFIGKTTDVPEHDRNILKEIFSGTTFLPVDLRR